MTETPEQQQQPIPGPSEYGEPGSVFQTPNYGDQFLNEQLTRNTMLFQTDIKPFTIDFLDELDDDKNIKIALSAGCRTFLKKLHVSLFDMSKILSMLDAKTFSFEESILWAKLLVNMGKVHYETFDYNNPLSLTIPEETMYNYRHFLTRAVMGKEREYQSRIAFSNDSTQTQVIKDMRGPQKKGRFFGLF